MRQLLSGLVIFILLVYAIFYTTELNKRLYIIETKTSNVLWKNSFDSVNLDEATKDVFVLIGFVADETGGFYIPIYTSGEHIKERQLQQMLAVEEGE